MMFGITGSLCPNCGKLVPACLDICILCGDRKGQKTYVITVPKDAPKLQIRTSVMITLVEIAA